MSLFWFDKSAHLGFLDCFSTRANKRLAVRGFISAWFPNAVVIVVLCPGFFCSYSYPSLPPLLLLPSILLLPPLLSFTSSSFIFVFFLSHLPCIVLIHKRLLIIMFSTCRVVDIIHCFLLSFYSLCRWIQSKVPFWEKIPLFLAWVPLQSIQ